MILGSSLKNKLNKSPFVRGLEHGARNEGHWKHESMVLQLED